MENSCAWEAKLYQLGEREFGIKRYSVVFRFDDGSLRYGGNTCKKM